MAALSSPNLIDQLRLEFPSLDFKPSEQFYYSSSTQTIFYAPSHPHQDLLLLHELAHHLLGHADYSLDVELLKMECAAWDKTGQLCQKYAIKWQEDFAEDQLDTYRDHLHKNSTCPECQTTSYQAPDQIYHCPHCHERWHIKSSKRFKL